MIDTLEKASVIPGIKYFGPARIISDQEEHGYYRILINRNDEDHESFNTLAYAALPNTSKLNRGDTVLVAGEKMHNFYIIGILHSQCSQQNIATSLETQDGAKALISGQPDEEKLQFFSQDGELIFEYNSRTRKSHITVPSGDLDVRTAKGDINFTSTQGILFSAENPIEMQSSRGIKMTVPDKNTETVSFVQIQSQHIDLESSKFGVSAQKGMLQIEETEYEGLVLDVAMYSVKCVMKRFESVSDTVIENIKNVYRKVKGLTQLQTGRMRTIVESTYQLKSNKTILKAEDDFKIKGEKIYLG
ncbi:MAG: DUF3540 domain-containing protein [Candidatus Latescibacteria bacterium]|nr:DUF3540 domain-containing protein [Candidatus Latescibacterota bacterium]